MDKKEYQVPSMEVVKIAMTSIICNSITSISTGGDGDDDTGIGYGGGGSGPARARSFGGWDDEE